MNVGIGMQASMYTTSWKWTQWHYTMMLVALHRMNTSHTNTHRQKNRIENQESVVWYLCLLLKSCDEMWKHHTKYSFITEYMQWIRIHATSSVIFFCSFKYPYIIKKMYTENSIFTSASQRYAWSPIFAPNANAIT